MKLIVFFIDLPKDFFAYQKDTKTKRAVERNIEIIGEAMSRILDHDETIIFFKFKENCGYKE